MLHKRLQRVLQKVKNNINRNENDLYFVTVTPPVTPSVTSKSIDMTAL